MRKAWNLKNMGFRVTFDLDPSPAKLAEQKERAFSSKLFIGPLNRIAVTSREQAQLAEIALDNLFSRDAC